MPKVTIPRTTTSPAKGDKEENDEAEDESIQREDETRPWEVLEIPM